MGSSHHGSLTILCPLHCRLVYGFGTNKVTKEAYNMHTCTQDACVLTNEYASQTEIKKWKSWN
jgi:hypothetical protein